jgi:hypothetical protein
LDRPCSIAAWIESFCSTMVLQLHEDADPAAAGSVDSRVESLGGLLVGQLEDQPERFLER